MQHLDATGPGIVCILHLDATRAQLHLIALCIQCKWGSVHLECICIKCKRDSGHLDAQCSIVCSLAARPCWQLVKIHPQGSRVRTSTPSSEKVPARPARNLQAFSTRVSLRATLSRDRNLSSLRCFGARRGGVCSDPARTPTELGARKKPDPPAAPAAGPPSPAVPPPPPPTQPSKPSKPSQVPIHGTGGL